MQASPTAGWLSALERELKLVGAGLNGTNEPSAEICDRVCPGRGADEVVRDRAAGAAGAAGADDKEVASGR
jgi:hypothetical protein